MASESLKVEYEVVDKATQALGSIRREIDGVEREVGELGKAGDKTGKSLDGTEKSAKKTGDSVGKMGKGSEQAGGMLGKLDVAAIGTTAAIGGLVLITNKAIDAVMESIDAYNEQFQVDQRLRSSIRMTSRGVGNVNAKFEELTGTIGQLAGATQFGDEAISGALSTLQDLTGQTLDATEAEHQLNTVLGMAAQRQMDATSAAQLYAKAKMGEVRALKKVLPLSKDEAEELNKIEDGTERARIAVEMLDEAYGGAAQRLNTGYFAALKNLQDAQGDLQQAVGKSIVDNEEFGEVLVKVHDQLRKIEGFVADGGLDPLIEMFSETTGDALLMLEALEKLNGQLETNSETTDELAGYTDLLNQTQNYSIPVIGTAIMAWDGLTLAAESYTAEQDEVRDGAESLEGAFQTAKGSWDELTDAWGGNLDQGVKDKLNEIRMEFERNPFKAALAGPQTMEFTAEEIDADKKRREEAEKRAKAASKALGAAHRQLELARATTDFERERIEYAHKLEDIRAESLSKDEERARLKAAELERERTIAERRRENLTLLSDLTDQADKEVRAGMKRDELAKLRLELLGTEDQLKRAALEKEIALAELEDKGLRKSERNLELARIEKEHADASAAQKKAHDELEAKREKELHDKKVVHMQEYIDQQREAGEVLARAVGDNPFGVLTGDLNGVIAQFRTMRNEGKDVQDALSQSFAAGEQAISGFLQEMGVSQRVHNALMAATSTARGFYDLAIGNVPGSIAAFSAAGIYGAHAIAAGGSSSGSGSAPSAGSTPASAPSRQDALNIAYKANLKALREARNESRTSTFILDQSGSTFLERDPTSIRRVRQTLEGNERLRLTG